MTSSHPTSKPLSLLESIAGAFQGSSDRESPARAAGPGRTAAEPAEAPPSLRRPQMHGEASCAAGSGNLHSLHGMNYRRGVIGAAPAESTWIAPGGREKGGGLSGYWPQSAWQQEHSNRGEQLGSRAIRDDNDPLQLPPSHPYACGASSPYHDPRTPHFPQSHTGEYYLDPGLEPSMQLGRQGGGGTVIRQQQYQQEQQQQQQQRQGHSWGQVLEATGKKLLRSSSMPSQVSAATGLAGRGHGSGSAAGGGRLSTCGNSSGGVRSLRPIWCLSITFVLWLTVAATGTMLW